MKLKEKFPAFHRVISTAVTECLPLKMFSLNNILFNCSLCWQWQTIYWPPAPIVQVNLSGPSYKNGWTEADETKMEPCSLNHRQDWSTHGLRVGGGACCHDTGRIQSGGPAALLDNTLDPQVTPNWPLTCVVTPNQGSHAHADSGEGWCCLPAVRDTERRAAPRISIMQSDICKHLKSHLLQSLFDMLSSTWHVASWKCVSSGSNLC